MIWSAKIERDRGHVERVDDHRDRLARVVAEQVGGERDQGDEGEVEQVEPHQRPSKRASEPKKRWWESQSLPRTAKRERVGEELVALVAQLPGRGRRRRPGSRASSTSSVIAIAKTPSLNATTRLNSNSASSRLGAAERRDAASARAVAHTHPIRQRLPTACRSLYPDRSDRCPTQTRTAQAGDRPRLQRGGDGRPRRARHPPQRARLRRRRRRRRLDRRDRRRGARPRAPR